MAVIALKLLLPARAALKTPHRRYSLDAHQAAGKKIWQIGRTTYQPDRHVGEERERERREGERDKTRKKTRNEKERER